MKKGKSRDTQYAAEDIITGLKEKRSDVFEYLYKEFGGMIAGHVIKNSGSEEDAREMVQITMVKLWQLVNEGRYAEQGKLGHFIFQLAANTWREELRRRRNNPREELKDQELQLIDDHEDAIHWALVKEKKLFAIQEGLKLLHEECRKIIEWYHLAAVSLQQIAAEQNIDYNNLRKRIFDCRKKLKQVAIGLMDD
ncbi:MAG TPA: sigma-70 family RNA polymerase sigma factor [Saprospiraceae bacterium]|nr:sigma-70 family RNA polymerase sigma factor [Saprospiraceae bacterium]HMQ82983.1 sigma-70 family RNA polymerase sigma factor [Saprospiraceae bacterium]